MKYAKVFTSRKQAISAGRKALKSQRFVTGVRGGKIRSSNANLVPVRVRGGYVIVARRKK